MSATLERRLSRFGVGPKINLSAIGYAALAGAATWIWPDTCLLRAVPYPFFLIPGLLLTRTHAVACTFENLSKICCSDRFSKSP